MCQTGELDQARQLEIDPRDESAGRGSCPLTQGQYIATFDRQAMMIGNARKLESGWKYEKYVRSLSMKESLSSTCPSHWGVSSL